MAQKNPFVRMLNTFQDNWEDLAPDLKDEISVELEKDVSPLLAVETVFKRHHLSDKLKQWISEACINAAEKGGVKFASDLTARHFFLNEVFEMDGKSLSSRVTKMAFKDDVVSTIQANLNSGERFGKLVTNLSQYTTEEKLPKGLLELEQQARRVMAGDVEAFTDFQKVLNQERSVAMSAIHDGDETVLKRSYLRLVNAAEKLQEDGLNAAVENAIDQKARSAAFRIAHTETARAYGMGVKTRADMDEDCTGIEWDLSSAENHCEICEDLDGQVFPVDELPEYPAHPHCSCVLSLYYGNKSELSDTDKYETDDTTIPEEMLVDDEEE